MAKKYQVFISSTYEDLKTQRDEVVKTILRIGHLPVGMEMFNAGNDTQWEIIKRYIDNCDYYVVILAHRYGSEAPDGMGYTEKEYEYAQAQGVPCLGFIIHDDADWSPKLIAKGEQAIKLEAFKNKIKNRMVSFWRSTDNLALLVSNGLTETFITHPRTGWVRATEAASPQVAEELARLSRENKTLTEQLAAVGTYDAFAKTQAVLERIAFHYNKEKESKTVTYDELFTAVCDNQQIPELEEIMESVDNSSYAIAQVDNYLKALQELIFLDLIAQSYPGAATQYVVTEKGKDFYIRRKYSS